MPPIPFPLLHWIAPNHIDVECSRFITVIQLFPSVLLASPLLMQADKHATFYCWLFRRLCTSSLKVLRQVSLMRIM